MKKPRIVVLGPNPAWQKTLFFKQLHYGEVNRAHTMLEFASGKGINFSRATGIWGQAVAQLVQFAGGDNGRKLLSDLDAEGLAHTTLAAGFATRGCTTCLSEADGQMTELIEPSYAPAAAACRAATAAVATQLEHADALALCGTLPNGMAMDFYVAAVQKARELRLPVLIDSWKDIEPVLNVGGTLTLKINLDELRTLSGVSTPETAIGAMVDRYKLAGCAITDGARCAYYGDARQIRRFTVPKIERVVNPVGSGDTASAVFWSELLSGAPPETAFALALGAASANCLSAKCGSYDPAVARRLAETVQITIVNKTPEGTYPDPVTLKDCQP